MIPPAFPVHTLRTLTKPRASRVYTRSTSVGVSGTETASASASATEGDSLFALNTPCEGRARKKRSKSGTHTKERVSRKEVQVSDFEMMRVPGKG